VRRALRATRLTIHFMAVGVSLASERARPCAKDWREAEPCANQNDAAGGFDSAYDIISTYPFTIEKEEKEKRKREKR
jgi:hypothetical protein